MKWDDVVITDREGKDHKGQEARRFVEEKCNRPAIGTRTSGALVINATSPMESDEDKDVRKFLFDKLAGKANSIRFWTEKDPQRAILPLARSNMNLLVVNPTKLKIEFVYVTESGRFPLTQTTARVTVDFAGNQNVKSKNYWREAQNSVVDLGYIPPGRYKLTPQYPGLDPCKYYFITDPIKIDMDPGDDITVTFEVALIYQKVQFIAHCLLTIPIQIFEESEKDTDKVEVSEVEGKRKFKFLQKPIDLGRFNSGDLDPPLPAGVKITNVNNEGIGKLTLDKKIVYWTRQDLDMTEKNLAMIQIGKETSPTSYEIQLNPGLTHKDLDKEKLKTEKAEIQLGQQPDAVGAKYYLQLLEKKNYWTIGELEESEKQAFHFDKIVSMELAKDSSNVYNIVFSEPVNIAPSMPPVSKPTTIQKSPAQRPPVQKPPPPKAVLRPDILDKTKGKLAFNEKISYWQLDDLDPRTMSQVKIRVLRELPNNANPNVKIHEIQFQKKGEFYSVKDLAGQWKAKYHGYPTDLKDIETRVAFVKETIEKAYARSEKDPTILKVFMIPECFFQGLYGAYLTEDASTLLGELQKLVSDVKWRDWVFSFGTVNGVFLGDQPRSITEKQEIYEMVNNAPVIRGGLGELHAAGKASTRMIQKLVNSAELADYDSLIEDPEVKKMRLNKDDNYRPQAVNENVQFHATVNDNKIARYLVQLLNDNREELFGLPKDVVSSLKAALKELVKTLGIARVVRQIRTTANADVQGKPLTQWTFCAKDLTKQVVEPLYRTRKTCLLTLDQATLMVIRSEWNSLKPESEFNSSEWVQNDDKRNTLLELPEIKHKSIANACGFILTVQQNEIYQLILSLKNNEEKAKKFVPEGELKLPFEPGIYPIWRKLLELYAEELAIELPFEFEQSGMNLEDYCFAGPRKAGPWFDKLEAAKGLNPCQRMVFGLEICADHPTKRLFALNQNSNENQPPDIGIDIHLLPSAGMSPNYFAARNGGYIFNCDGWNKAHPNGGKKIRVEFDGPLTAEGEEISASPVFPHSAVGKRSSDAMQVSVCLEPEVEELKSDLIGVIFPFGAGELHFYPLQDLPK